MYLDELNNEMISIIQKIPRPQLIDIKIYLRAINPKWRYDPWEIRARLDIMLEFFEENEAYELCQKIHNIIKEIDENQIA